MDQMIEGAVSCVGGNFAALLSLKTRKEAYCRAEKGKAGFLSNVCSFPPHLLACSPTD